MNKVAGQEKASSEASRPESRTSIEVGDSAALNTNSLEALGLLLLVPWAFGLSQRVPSRGALLPRPIVVRQREVQHQVEGPWYQDPAFPKPGVASSLLLEVQAWVFQGQ